MKNKFELLTVAKFNSWVEAQMMKELLNSYDIEAFPLNSELAFANIDALIAYDYFKLATPLEDIEEAENIIYAINPNSLCRVNISIESHHSDITANSAFYRQQHNIDLMYNYSRFLLPIVTYALFCISIFKELTVPQLYLLISDSTYLFFIVLYLLFIYSTFSFLNLFCYSKYIKKRNKSKILVSYISICIFIVCSIIAMFLVLINNF